MQVYNLPIISNKEIFKGVFLLSVETDITFLPGQFANFAIDGFTLRRPISIHDQENGEASFIYRVVGEGTKAMASLKSGETINTLMPLGNCFDNNTDKPLLIGGGMGIAPLKYLARVFRKDNITPQIILAGRNKDEVEWFYNDLQGFGDISVTTDDGSMGFKGRADEFIKTLDIKGKYYYCCGPTPMLKAIAKSNDFGELSLEARMGCGFGACMGCSIKTTNGPQRVCKEGPIFPAKEVIFDD